ncbi:MAG TPA: DUF2950 domain-containing protein [Candidatus Sulfopaludibacter sp.]|nr:DUF2950 domain-containing protein [Candidatus Sulfopaludibacter sp.]
MRALFWTILPLAVTLACLSAAPQAASGPRTFATPEEAARALIDAAAKNDTAAMLKVFGPGGKDIVDSGDPAAEKEGRANFARRAADKMRIDIDPGNPNRATVVVGQDDWPLPVPLVRLAGQWRFDAGRGRVEILARRIGRNELGAIEVCRGYVEAQMDYASHDRDGDGTLQYAQKIIATPGKKDGMYWEGDSPSLAPKSFADAAAALLAAQGKKAVPYHGYFFHILRAQGPDAQGGALDYVVKGKMIGGFALVAWPAEYGVSGVKTFIVNHSGVVYSKDMGPATATLARQMVRYNPDKTWKPVPKE